MVIGVIVLLKIKIMVNKMEIGFYAMLDALIARSYQDRVCFLYAGDVSFFDAGEVVPQYPEMYSFSSVDEFEEWQLSSHANIVDNLSMLWIDGERDEKVIYNLRG